jgi:aminoglycoside phosphotransferase (APT) family kinase protein
VRWLPHTLVHGDYWPANVIIHRAHLSGIVDWTHATLGDPRSDVAQCRLDLALIHDLAVADRFLDAYQHLAGPLAHGRFFDAVKAIESLPHVANYDHWVKGYHDLALTDITVELAVQRCRAFLAHALDRAPG